MARTMHRLSAANLRGKPAGKYADGNGLWLYKSHDDSAK